MSIQCPNCSQLLEFEGPLPANAQKFQCTECQHKFFYSQNEQSISEINPSQLLMRALDTPQMSGAGWAAPEAEEMDESLEERYSVERLLGRGGMGAVYLAKDTRLDRRVAIKMLPPEMGEHPEAHARFEREAKALAALEHPNIINVYDYGTTDEGHHYFVMEFIEGMDLHELRNSGQIGLSEALDIVSQVCAALQYAHQKGIIHRDIKPANILVSHEGVVKVADFGLAKALGTDTQPNVDPTLTVTGSTMGTPDYMAPEQREGADTDHRADIYALGVMLYDLLTGAPPRGAWSPPSEKVEIDIRLDEIIIRALQENPVARYQAASELKGDVDSVKSTTGGLPIPPGTAVEPLPSSRKGSGIAKPRVASTSFHTSQSQQSDSSHQPVQDVPAVDAIVETTKSTNRTMLLLGTFAILTLGAIAIYVGAFKKDGDTYNTVNNTSYQEIQNNYFSQIIVNGTTTKEDLEKIQGIKPYGTLFVGISKNPLTLTEAQDLAKRTGSTILDYTTDQPNKPAPLNKWITSAFSLQQKAWVRLHTQHQTIDGKATLTTATAESKHHVLLSWQGPKELMMQAKQEELKEKPKSDHIKNLTPSQAPELLVAKKIELFKASSNSDIKVLNDGVFPPNKTSAMVSEHFYRWSGSLGEIVLDMGKEVLISDLAMSVDNNDSYVVEVSKDKVNYSPLLTIFKAWGNVSSGSEIFSSESGTAGYFSKIDFKYKIARYIKITAGDSDHTRAIGEIQVKGVENYTLPWVEPVQPDFIIDPRRKIYTKTWSDGVRGDFVNYEPGKWKEVFGTKGVFFFVETARNKDAIEIFDKSRGVKFVLKETECELYSNGVFFKRTAGKWIESRDDVTSKLKGIEKGIPTDALEFNGHYYKFYPSKKNWEEAAKECEARGGQLATANTLAEHHQLSMLAKKEHVWVGANNKADGMRWLWTDNSEIIRSLWAWQSPSNPKDAKYVLLYNGFLQSGGITQPYVAGYLCEWSEDAASGLDRLPATGNNSSTPSEKIPADAAKFKGNHYVIYNSHENWYSAQEHCRKLGGSLATIGSQPELTFLTNLIKAKGHERTEIWLGACNLHEHNQWRWLRGAPYSLTNVIEGNADNRYLIIQYRKLIAKGNGSHYGKAFICEWEGDVIEPPTPTKRTLTNKRGKSIECEILSATATHVKVRRLKDNKEFNLKLDSLSQKDQDFIKEWRAKPKTKDSLNGR